MKIYAPVKDANGIYASVLFVNGVGETDNPNLIDWFKGHGFEVEEPCAEFPNYITEVGNEVIEAQDDEINFDDMTPVELRQWAVENGLGSKIKNIRNKEKLLEIVRG